MRKALLYLLLLIAIPPIPGQPPDQPTNKGANPKRNGGKKQQPSQQVSPVPVKPIPSQISQERGTKQKEGNDPVSVSTVKPLDVSADVQKDWMDKLNWSFTGTLVLIAGFGVWYARKTLKSIEGQLKEMRAAGKQTDEMLKHAGIQAEAAKRSTDVLINSERAWLIVSPIQPAKFKSVLPGEIPPYNQFRFTIANKGRTVAKLMDFRGAWRILDRDKRLPAAPDYGPVILDNLKPVHGRVLAPGGEPEEITFGIMETMDEEVLKALGNGDRRFYFYAFIKYFDFAELERRVQFCFSYSVHAVSYSHEQSIGDHQATWVIDGPPDYNTHT